MNEVEKVTKLANMIIETQGREINRLRDLLALTADLAMEIADIGTDTDSFLLESGGDPVGGTRRSAAPAATLRRRETAGGTLRGGPRRYKLKLDDYELYRSLEKIGPGTARVGGC